jgi:hypothetical protein
MDTATVEEWIMTALRPRLEAAGFSWHAPLHQFRRATPAGFVCVILAVSDFVDSALVEAHLGIRIDRVERLVFDHLNGAPGFRADSMTLVTPLARLYERRSQRFAVSDRASAAAAATQVAQQLDERGLSFLDTFSELLPLERLFNGAPEETVSLLHNPIHRCFRGLALAKLGDRPDLPALYATYREQLKEPYAADWALVPFTALAQGLLGYSLN